MLQEGFIASEIFPSLNEKAAQILKMLKKGGGVIARNWIDGGAGVKWVKLDDKGERSTDSKHIKNLLYITITVLLSDANIDLTYLINES